MSASLNNFLEKVARAFGRPWPADWPVLYDQYGDRVYAIEFYAIVALQLLSLVGIRRAITNLQELDKARVVQRFYRERGEEERESYPKSLRGETNEKE